MSSLPPLDVNVRSKRLSCILDTELALSRHGLLLAMRLAEEMNVWLVRTLWQILDNTQFYLAEPNQLLPAAGAGGASSADRRRNAAALVDTLKQWEAARLETDLGGTQIYWAGDARCESLLPKDVEKCFVERFEVLAADLDALCDRGGSRDRHDAARECSRDAVALATALMRHRPIIFTMCATSEGSKGGVSEPNLCRFLRQCGIGCRRIDDGRDTMAIKRHLLPILARAGVIELLWAGLNLAALHIVAPGALVMPVETEPARRFDERLAFLPPREPGRHAWINGASAFWWNVS